MVGFMPSGPCPENHSGILEFLGLVHAQLTQKVKNKNTHKKIKLSKREALLLPQAWASGHWRAGKKDQGWRNLEVYSQHPLPASVTPGRLWSVIICIHKVLEATGESHGCREGLGLPPPGMSISLPGEMSPPRQGSLAAGSLRGQAASRGRS